MEPKAIVEPDKIKIGISTCLLGIKVRYDGGHKQDHYITDTLARFFDFVPVCPEVEVGMGVPREAIRLTGAAEAPHMIGSRTGVDWTARMNEYAGLRVRKPDLQNINGYILKKDSPSCGMERVRVYGASGMPRKDGVGLFASHLLRQFSPAPIEEEGRLHDDRIRENFIERVFAHRRLQILFEQGYSRGRMVQFHTAHKYLILAHSPKHYKLLGSLVADIKSHSPRDFQHKYSTLFLEALAVIATIRKNVNVLQHIMGFFKDRLTPDDKRHLLSLIEDYHKGLVPLVVPMTMIKHYIRIFNAAYITDQIYLNPHPKELMLRNHV